MNSQVFDGWCAKFVAVAFGAPNFGFNTAWQGALAWGLHAGSPPPGALVFFRPIPGNPAGHVGIALPGNKMISAESNGVHVASLSVAYWAALYAGWTWAPLSWPGRPPTGAGPQLETPTPPPPTIPPPVQPPSPPPPTVNRHAITSYNRMTGGAPNHGYFANAWQPFQAQSNVITLLGVGVGTPALSPGATVPYSVTMRLCSAQPNSAGSCPGQLAEASAQIVNYGDTSADIGDVSVTAGSTYWVEWYQPPPVRGATRVTFWWAGGKDISSSDQLQMLVEGYNQ